jgi:regulatory protein
VRVTAIEPESRSGGVRVQVDGRPFGTVAPGDVAALGLSVGAVLDERAAGALTERAEVFGARTVALSMLAARALPSAELVRRLVRKGHAKGAAEAAIEGLGETGLIDDAEFARHYVRTHARQRLGPRRLDADLRRLGVADSVAEAAVRETLAADGVDPHAVLQEAAAKKVRALAGLDAETARRRLRSYLLRRGFGGAEVSAVVKDAFPR